MQNNRIKAIIGPEVGDGTNHHSNLTDAVEAVIASGDIEVVRGRPSIWVQYL